MRSGASGPRLRTTTVGAGRGAGALIAERHVFGGGAVVSLAQLKRGLHRLLKCRRRGVGLEAPPLSVVGPPIPGGAPVPAPPADDGGDGGADDADVEAHADEYADDAFDEDPSEKPGSYADDFFEAEASAG